jgi:hypothetical protein
MRASIVAGAAALISIAIAANSLVANGGDPTVFVGFGEEATATRAYAEDRLGEVVLREKQGHDGKFFFIQAVDPWLSSPSENAVLLDPPVYRSQRMLYPALSGGLGTLGPEATVWGLLVVNILGMAIGTYVTARLARLLGGSEWWGLAFALNFGLIFDLQNDGAGIVAACLAMWGVLMLYQGRHWLAIPLLVGAVLSREVMLVTAGGVAIWHWLEGRRRQAIATAVIPAACLGGWIAYVTARLGPDQTSVGAFSAPFTGLIEAFPSWLREPATLATALAVLLLMAVYALRWATSRTALGWAYVGFVGVSVVMSARVWEHPFDFARAQAPLLTAAVMLVFVETSSPMRRSGQIEGQPNSEHMASSGVTNQHLERKTKAP